jgi:beta-glucosidase
VVSVFLSGRPLWTNPEINASDAFVAAWLPGGEGVGVADVLVADGAGEPRHDFTGRLSFSWPNTPLQGRLNPHHPDYAPLFPLGYGLDYASGEQGPGLLETGVPGIAAGAADIVTLYSGRPLPPWSVFINGNDGAATMMSGSYAAHASGIVTARAVDMKVQEDALSVGFSGTGRGRIMLTGPGLDLGEFRAEGMLTFVLRQDRPAADLRLFVGEGSFDLAARGEALVDKGWVEVSVPLACFAGADAELDQVAAPFALESDSAVEVAFGEIRYLRKGEPTLVCD